MGDPGCVVCSHPLPTVRHRLYCSPKCRSTATNRRHRCNPIPNPNRTPQSWPRPTIVEPAGEWTLQAACTDTSTDMFFPERQVGRPTRSVDTHAAVTICRACPVREDCLDYALANNEQHGIWGGLTPQQRRLRRRETSVA